MYDGGDRDCVTVPAGSTRIGDGETTPQGLVSGRGLCYDNGGFTSGLRRRTTAGGHTNRTAVAFYWPFTTGQSAFHLFSSRPVHRLYTRLYILYTIENDFRKLQNVYIYIRSLSLSKNIERGK